MILKNVTGVSDVQGTSAKNGKTYSIGRLFRLTPMKDWKNDNGRALVAGYVADERGALDIDLSNQNLVGKLFSLEEHFPTDLEIKVQPHPDDPLRNIIVDIQHPALSK